MNQSRNRAKLKVPPTGFYYIDHDIYRGLTPITRQNMTFLLQDLQINTIINVSNDVLDISSLSAMNEEVVVHNMHQGEDFLHMRVASAEDYIKRAMELILCSQSVFILGSQQLSCHVDMVLVAILRRLQKWSLTSVLSEFRTNVGQSLFDVEQFIEYFDTDLIDLPPSLPDYLLAYESLMEEESAIADQMAASRASREPTEKSSGLVLAQTLLFSDNQRLLLPGTSFDASVSLITEDVED